MGINVLSLFDGMSCGQIALERAGLEVDNYFASEIDKYAIAVTQHNYPNTIQLGDVTQWRNWNIPKPDLIMGGSPCQGFSFAGAGLNFEDPRSRLFFTFSDIVKCFNPKYFLLENVKMKKEHQNIISEYLGVEPIEINSALVSAQNRKRLYWTNIQYVEQPLDKGIFLKDVVEFGEVDRTKSYCIEANYSKGGSKKNYLEKKRRQIDNLPTKSYQSERRLMVRVGTATDIKGHDYNKPIYSKFGKSPTISAMSGGNLEPKVALDDYRYRKLTPLECERLQTIPEGYTICQHPVYKNKSMSDTQRYKMLGNGWTVDVIAHILKHAEFNK